MNAALANVGEASGCGHEIVVVVKQVTSQQAVWVKEMASAAV